MQWFRGAAVALVGFLGCNVGSVDAIHTERVVNTASAVSVNPPPSAAAGSIDSSIPGEYSLVAHGSAPQVAFGGSTYFIAWTEGRASTSNAIKGDSNQDIFATRLGETGEALDTTNLQLSQIRLPPIPGDLQFAGELSRERLRIAAGDAGAIAAWLETSTASDEVSISGAIVSTEGVVTRFTIDDVIRTYQGIDGRKNYLNGTHVLTADSGGYCVFYYSPNFGGGIDLAYRRITPSGAVGSKRVAVANRPQPFNTYSFTASSNSSSAIFAWEPYMEVGGYFVTPFSGSPTATIHESSGNLGGDGIPNPAYFSPHAARSNADGTHAIAVTDGYAGFRTINIDASGNISSLGTRTAGTNSKIFTYFPDPSGGFDVAEWSTGEICVMQLTNAGVSECKKVALDPDRNQSGYAFGQEGGAFGKTTIVESRVDNERGKPAIVSRYLKSTATFETAVTLSKSANSEEAPSIATDGDGYVVFWRDTRTSTTKIAPSLYAMRLDANGVPASPAVQVATEGIVATTIPKIIFDGSKYFATWYEAPATEEGGRILAAVLPRSGALVVEKVITVGEGVFSFEQAADATSDGVNRIVVWSAFGSGGGISVFGKRIDLVTDAILDTEPISISANDSTFHGSAQIAFDGSRSVVTWIEVVEGPRKIAGTFIEKGQGAPKDAPKVFVDDGAFAWTTRLATAPGRGSFLVWGSQSSDVFDMNVHGLFISPTGETSAWNGATKIQNDTRASTPIFVGAFDARAPVVAYAEDKANFFAVWEDNRAGNYDLRGTWIGTNDGMVRDPNGVEVAALPTAEINPAIAMSKDGNGLVVYQEFVSGPTSNAYRLRVRKVNSGLILGTACTSNDACGTRQCVDGVCCESGCEGGCGVCNATPGTCLPKEIGTACGHLKEYMCGGTTTSCPSSCTSNDECISHSCTNGTCEPPEARCVDDFTLRDAKGVVTSCGDYKCKNNACRNPCVDVSDCANGLICSFSGACETPPEVQNDPSPSCSMRPAGNANFWSIGLLAIVLPLVRRRSSRAGLALGIVAALCGFLACSRLPDEPGSSPMLATHVASGEVALGHAMPFRTSLHGFYVAHENLHAHVEPTGTLSVASQRSPSVTLSTESLGREKAITVNADAPALEAGVVSRRFGRVIERVEARAEGIETSWILDEKPAGEGDFVVRQQVRSGRALASGNGIRFTDEHLRLSEGRLVDASGMSTLIPARLVGDVIEYRVARELIEASTYPAILDPTISNDVLIKQDENVGYATQRVTPDFNAYDPNIGFAFDGTNYLVAWCDTRAIGTTVMAALVSKDGALLSPDALSLGRFEVSPSAVQENNRNLRVVAGGGGFMVTWSTSTSDGQLSHQARRVRTNGTLVDGAPIDLGILSYRVETSGNADGFYVVHVRQTGLNKESFSLTYIKPATESDPALSTFTLGESTGGYSTFIVRNDLLLYSQYEDRPGHMYSQKFFSVRFGPNGALRAIAQIAPFQYASLYALAFDGTQYVVTGYDSGYFARYLGADGLTLGASGPVDSNVIAADADGLTTSSQTLPTQICNYNADFSPKGSCYLIPPDVFVARGSVLAVGTLSNTVGARGWVPVLRRLDRFTGVPLTASETVLARSANSQYAPSLAYDSATDTYVGVWIDDKDGDSAVIAPADGGAGSGGLRVTASTIRANGATFDVSKAFNVSSAGAENVADPDVVSLGSGSFFAVWSEDVSVDGTTRHRIAGARMQFSAGGVASISPTVELATSTTSVHSPRIVNDSAGPILTWTDGTLASGGRVLMKRVALDSSGDAGSSLIVSASADGRWRPESAAVFDGKETLIAWIESDQTSSRIKGVVVPDGAQTPSATASSLETNFSLKEHLRIGTDKRGSALLTWSAITAGSHEVRAIGISPAQLGGIDTRASFRVAGTTETTVSEPSIAYANDGESYAIVWSERAVNQGSDSLLHGTWVGLDGRVFDQPSGRRITEGASPSGFDPSFETNSEDEGLPALATGPSTTTGLIYVRFNNQSGVKALRAHFRALSSGRTNGTECSVNEECSSRYCVSGICCNAACDDGCGQCGGAAGAEKGICSPLPGSTVCGGSARYICSGSSTTCPTSCDDNGPNTCAPNYVCREHVCSPAGGSCYDESSIATANGPSSCAPYKCVAGACGSTCASVDDCSDGNVCDFSLRCVPWPAQPPSDSTSCAMSRSSASVAPLIGFGLIALVSARRRSKRPSDQTSVRAQGFEPR